MNILTKMSELLRFPIKQREPAAISLPDLEEFMYKPETIFIKIHDHDNLSARDRGKALATYVRANKLRGIPDWERSKDGVFAFVLLPTAEELERRHKARVAKQEELDKTILSMVRMELLTPR